MKTTFLCDELVALRSLTKADIDGNYGGWFNDPNVVKDNSHGRFPMTYEKLQKFIVETEGNLTALVLAVVLRESDTHVGNISLQNINWIDRSAEIAFILGETSHQGKGIMYRAGMLLIQHAFRQLNLRRIYCGTTSTNQRMIRLAGKLGMQEEGCRRGAIYKNGRYLDILEYGIIRDVTQ